jgi:hypothetical protein
MKNTKKNNKFMLTLQRGKTCLTSNGFTFSTNPSIMPPEKVYKNPAKEKQQIFFENDGLTGIYF